MSEDFMKKPCKHCPFRIDVKPFLHPERGEELAYAAQNRYNSFPCHKTTESDDETGDCHEVESSKQCAGFLTLMASELGEDEIFYDDFLPSFHLVYESSWDMSDAYGDSDIWQEMADFRAEHNRRHGTKK